MLSIRKGRLSISIRETANSEAASAGAPRLRGPMGWSRRRRRRPSRYLSCPSARCWSATFAEPASFVFPGRFKPPECTGNAVPLNAVENNAKAPRRLPSPSQRLRHVRRHRMAGVAEQGHVALRPAIQRIAIDQRPLCTSGQAASYIFRPGGRALESRAQFLDVALADHDSILNSGSGWLVTNTLRFGPA